jgi:hypothetical protein
MQQLAKGVVCFTSLIFLLYGILFVFFPEQGLMWVVQGQVTSTAGITDVRATYGGMSLGVALILYLLVSSATTLRQALWCVCFFMAGMAFGRTVGIVVDGDATSTMYSYLFFEVVLALIALGCLFKLNAPADESH